MPNIPTAILICMLSWVPMCLSCAYELNDIYRQEWVNSDTCTWRCKQGYYRDEYPVGSGYFSCSTCDRDWFKLDANNRCKSPWYYYVPCIKDSVIEATKDGECVLCFNKPAKSTYISAGTVWNVSNCEWICDAGYYRVGDFCTPCSNGSYSYIPISWLYNSGCILCEPGKYITNDLMFKTQTMFGLSACIGCEQGTINTISGSSTCQACGVGSWGPTYFGATFCYTCSAGKYIDVPISSGGCINCNAGTYSLRNASACTLCAAGYYSSSKGVSTCKYCDAGTYTSSSNSTQCIACNSNICNAGQYLGDCGGATAEQCLAIPCAEGTYNAGPAGCLTCAYCDIGKYALGCGGLSPGTCTDCTNSE